MAYYFVTSEGFRIGKNLLPFNASNHKSSKGNMFIDCGVPPKILLQDLYNRIEMEVVTATSREPKQELRPQIFPKGTKCVCALNVTAHFMDGANLKLMPMNFFINVKDYIYCLAMTNTNR
ncbi:hypothetical protein Nepgr_024534 [Nepenthes gracilis]|uniref:Xylanase inhibitor C-terminal domain-containing protein n=1 Tax=Nepenthes gracilis TaxID=150966 RepID=A0AAD3T4Z9_NEPGR|nr:hypothetical protein Nepgr_024534 [Nepenthes gracilis]